jgi:hypothetical protein
MTDDEQISAERAPRERRVTLRELAWLFLRLGATSFGDSGAHRADAWEFVVRRRWLSPQAFVDLVGATNHSRTEPPSGHPYRFAEVRVEGFAGRGCASSSRRQRWC